ncbi:M20/M25/M40 family metallo-hydrolase [Fusibacter ferrireducens]|uniref:M20/M25/M40 family metallo-hydrolase n=1 Tax=Fusibacter ferrireducens TaxID=2785058 RepID=A0ABR9ZP56_9FIRM|nr:M20/M25/M40 family metallo-hydrolase [Fusibacter ferrireducens]MBF4692199.1 M20/M25/M40 family metallo-hydrolase [Fusibacter ferrireducens]
MDKIMNRPNNERMLSRFIEIAGIPGESKNELKIAEYLKSEYESLGFTVKFDKANEIIGGNIGNLYAYWEGVDQTVPPILFSCHMDTIFPVHDLNVVIEDGKVHSDGKTILGCDDRGAVAAYLEGIKMIQETNVTCGPIEVICSISEQRGLLGARNLDNSLVHAKDGYVFDHDGDYGKQIVYWNGYSYYVDIEIFGPQKQNGHFVLNTGATNAFVIAADFLKSVKLGDVDEYTKANLGLINGGEGRTIVPASVKLEGNVRSLTKENLDKQLSHIKDIAESVAGGYGGHAVVEIRKSFDGYKLEENNPLIQCAIMASTALDIEYHLEETMGGADANALREHGINAMTMGSGFQLIHTTDEYVTLDNLYVSGPYISALIQAWYLFHKKMT